MVFPEIIQKEGPSPLEYAEGMAKVNTGLRNADQGIGKVNLCFRKHLRAYHRAPESNSVQSYLISLKETHLYNNYRI